MNTVSCNFCGGSGRLTPTAFACTRCQGTGKVRAHETVYELDDDELSASLPPQPLSELDALRQRVSELELRESVARELLSQYRTTITNAIVQLPSNPNTADFTPSIDRLIDIRGTVLETAKKLSGLLTN